MATPTFILPSAPTYTEGFVNGLNVYPDPTNFVANQVPFTRATTATRTNAAGLIELTPYNLVQYSEQFENAAWSKAQASVTANSTTSPDGTTTADSFIETASLTGDKAIFTSPLSITAASTFNLSIYVKSLSGDRNVYLRAFDSSFTIGFGVLVNPLNGAIVTTQAVGGATLINTNVEILNNGWYRISASGILSTSTTLRFSSYLINGTNSFYTGNGTSGVFIWGAQVNEGTDALPYQLTETRLNRPRVDFSLGGCPNLLLEPQRTNLALRSEEFDNATWGNIIGGTGVNSTRVANSVISPSGIQNADTITLNRGSGNTISDFSFIFQGVTLVSSLYTLSFWIKANSPSEIGKTLMARVVGANILNQLITLTSSWQRFTFTSTATATAGLTGIDFYNRGTLTTGNSVTFDIWGAQLETGAYPTTYIPTSSATVTRNSDTFQLSNVFTNNLISSAGGTWFVDFKGNVDLNRSGSAGGLFLNTGTISLAGDGFLFRNPTTLSQKMSIIKYNSGTPSTLYNTLTENVKAAIKWNGTTADIFVNGVKVVSATAFTVTNMENLIGEGQNRTLQINSMALYPIPLSDTELINLTTL